MMVRCSLSLWKHTGSHITSSRGDKLVTRDSNTPLMMRSVLAPQPLPVINSRQCLSSFHTDCLNACHDHSLTCARASRLWFHTAFIYPLYTSLLFPVSLHLHSSTPPPPSGEVLLAAVQNFLFHFGDWQPRWYLPLICILCRLLSIPATNGGDSQTAVPELVCSSLGVRAANQRLWWEEKDGFKLHPSQSTGGAHESATSRRYSPSWGSLQIDSDSTPLTSETPTRASPIKSLLWFPLLIINASELGRAVIGVCLWGFLVHALICVSTIFARLCGCKCAFFPFSRRASMCCVFSCTFAAVFSFMWSPPPVCGGGYLIITTEKP